MVLATVHLVTSKDNSCTKEGLNSYFFFFGWAPYDPSLPQLPGFLTVQHSLLQLLRELQPGNVSSSWFFGALVCNSVATSVCGSVLKKVLLGSLDERQFGTTDTSGLPLVNPCTASENTQAPGLSRKLQWIEFPLSLMPVVGWCWARQILQEYMVTLERIYSMYKHVGLIYLPFLEFFFMKTCIVESTIKCKHYTF